MSDSTKTTEYSAIDAQTAAAASPHAAKFERVLDVRVEITAELGRRTMRIADVLALTEGSVVEFTKGADEPLDIRVNGQLVARGEAVVLGERYGVRITEVVSPNDRLRSSGLGKEGDA